MIVERNREFTINMGDYESVKIGARATVASDEAPEDVVKGVHPDNLASELAKYADRILTEALADDLKEAGELSGKRDTFILSWKVNK